MIIHIETIIGEKPILRVILDYDEAEPQDMEAVKSVLMQTIRTMPQHKEKLEVIRLKKPKGAE